MKRFVVALFLLVSLSVKAQDIEPFLRGIADKIIEDSRVAFINEESGEVFDVQEDSAPIPGLVVGSACAKWIYTSSMLCDGLYALSREVNNEKYAQYVVSNHQFLFDHMDFITRSVEKRKTRVRDLNGLGKFGGIWSCGPQGGALLNSYLMNKDPEFLDYVKKTAAHLEEIRSKQLSDPKEKMSHKGLDGIYAYVATLARLGKLTGELHYFDTCIELVKETELFYEPGVKLYAQSYYPDLQVTSNIFWLRGMGWTSVALVELLSCLPENHPDYDEVLSIYQKLMVGIAPYQTADGLWRHLVNRADSFEETSGSIFLVYAFAKGVNHGWLPERYRDVAMAGWRGMMSKKTEDGSIEGNTGSVRSGVSPVYHLNNSTKKTDSYLSGPLFLAGTEMLRLYQDPANLKPYTARWKFTQDPSAVNEATN